MKFAKCKIENENSIFVRSQKFNPIGSLIKIRTIPTQNLTSSSTNSNSLNKMSQNQNLKIENDLVICGDEELALYVSHLDHLEILKVASIDVGIKDAKSFLEPFNRRYNLRIVESLLIQSR